MAEMTKISAVWKQKTRDGRTFYKGRLGDADLLLFPSKSDHPKAPAFDVLITKHENRERAEQPQHYQKQRNNQNDNYTRDYDPGYGNGGGRPIEDDYEDVPF